MYLFASSIEEGSAPDFIIADEVVVELKNWNCEEYEVDEEKACTEIVSRFEKYPNKKKILIIAKPKWKGRAKQYIQDCGIRIIELGYVVNKETFTEAINDLEKIVRIILGYVYRPISSIIRYARSLYRCIKSHFSMIGFFFSKVEKSLLYGKILYQGPETIDLNREAPSSEMKKTKAPIKTKHGLRIVKTENCASCNLLTSHISKTAI